ncbi:hypothetical protein CQ13_28685 [Bradyrhizobium retamae]|uniref:Uncharacterized protein n=1 Tax=Bradyrhizobium retamae TaxID=1300035 RepID=A0A0R3MX47_9BRAD|nr:hypothetical protein CQ13_28685 [Bradyrhizobium retamae]
MHPAAVFASGILCLASAAAIDQTTAPQPRNGMPATSPFNARSSRPAGIPLGSTEIAMPGISPLNPSLDIVGCAASGSAASPSALFDGGGLSNGSSIVCSGNTAASSLQSLSSTVEHLGIPLGATEIGGAGISPAVPVPGPGHADNTSSIGGSGNP